VLVRGAWGGVVVMGAWGGVVVRGAWGGVVVKALRYWSEGTGIDPRSLGIFSVPCALGSTQPLKMSTRIFLGVKTAGA